MIAWLISLGLTDKTARIFRVALLVLAAVAVLAIIVMMIRADARHDERERQQLQIERDKAVQAERERRAGEDLRNREAIDRAAAEQRRKENEDAVRNIPDQATSPRQRAAACVRLRRERPADSRAIAACGPAEPR